MLPFEKANELVNLLQDRFDGMVRTDRDRDSLRSWISDLDPNDQIVVLAIEQLVSDWSQRRNPTKPEIKKAVDRARAAWRSSHKIRGLYEAAREFRSRYGDSFLSMFARSSSSVCVSCADDYVERGVALDNKLLRHEHIPLEEVEKDPALELAITLAKGDMPHPLDSVATERAPGAAAKMMARIKAAMAPKKPIAAERGNW